MENFAAISCQKLKDRLEAPPNPFEYACAARRSERRVRFVAYYVREERTPRRVDYIPVSVFIQSGNGGLEEF